MKQPTKAGIPKQVETSCVLEINSEKEYQEIVNNYPETVFLHHWSKCPGCQEMRSELDTACKKNNLGMKSPVAVISCEVGANPWCAKIWDESRPQGMTEKDYGVPNVVVIPNKGSHKKPDAQLISASPEKKVELHNIMAQLGQFAQQVAGQTQAQRAPSTPSAQGSQVSASAMSQAPMRSLPVNSMYPAQMYGSIAGYIAEKPSYIYNVKSSPNYQKRDPMFCVHGVDCDYSTFNQKIQNYLFS